MRKGPSKIMAPRLLAALVVVAAARGQYLGEENKTALQRTAVVDGLSRDLDEIGPTIVTDRTTTYLNCAAGSMLVDIEFKEPFFGLIHPNGSRNSACITHGSGATRYHLELPLKGCGTDRVERRVFLNNIIVRFHKGLELEGDEVKTIICRYPSPEVLLHPVLLPFKRADVPLVPPPANQIGELEILMIISGIMFLTLGLVGMACSFTCLKKRNISLIQRRPMSSLAPSTISRMSGSSMFVDGLKIPRATVTSSSGSEAALVSQSETLPSDYPSESPSSGSEVEEADVLSLEQVNTREEMQAYENTAFEIEERLSSVYSDGMIQSDAEMVTAHQIARPPQPSFMVRVKKPITPPRTPEPDYPIQMANSQSLTTIFERDESFRPDSIPDSEHAMMLSVAGDLEPPAMFNLQPKYNQVQRESQSIPQPPPPPPSDYNIQRTENLETITKEFTDIQDIEERTARRLQQRRPPSDIESDYASDVRSVQSYVEPMIMVAKPPVKTTHKVDDRHLSVLTETHVTEDVERRKIYTKQYHHRPKPPKWNVAIRHYPGPKYADEMESSGPEWENYSEPGSEVFRQQLYYGADSDTERPELLEHPPPPNWNILVRVLDAPETMVPEVCVLTEEDRDKWYQILHTESTLRTMLTTATIREDFERIRYDHRYEQLFPPEKWDVIIRILTPPRLPRTRYDTGSSDAVTSDTDSVASRESRRPRPRRKVSLPAVQEMDTPVHARSDRQDYPASSRRSSKSSVVSGVRSVTETEVNFGRVEDPSGPYRRPSGSGPEYPDTDTDSRHSAKTGRSLARSTSEFVEDWRMHPSDPADHYSDASSGAPRRTERSVSEYIEEPQHYPHTSPEGSPRRTRRLFQDGDVNEERVFSHSSHQQVVTRGGNVTSNAPRGFEPTNNMPRGFEVTNNMPRGYGVPSNQPRGAENMNMPSVHGRTPTNTQVTHGSSSNMQESNIVTRGGSSNIQESNMVTRNMQESNTTTSGSTVVTRGANTVRVQQRHETRSEQRRDDL